MKFLQSFLIGTVFLAVCATTSFAQEDAASTVLKPGSKFPHFVLPDADGREVSLGDFRGKAILLSFWSCYTDTCFTSVRVIENLLKEYSSKGLVAPTVCSEIPPALEKNNYAGLLERCGTGQIVLIDKEMKLGTWVGIEEFPTTFLIDKNNVIVKAITGIRPIMEEEFREMVRSLVTE